MADQKITFTIGSIFKGEGFKNAQSTIANLNKEVKKGAGDLGQIAGAFGGMDASCGKAMQAVSGMVGALVSLNATTIIVQAAMIAVSQYTQAMTDKMDAAKTRADNLKSSLAGVFDKTLQTDIQSTLSQVKSITDEFDRITKSANAFSSAINGLANAQDNETIIDLQTQKLQALIDNNEKGMEKIIVAEYDVAIAEERYNQVRERGTKKLESAIKAENDTKERSIKLEQQLNALIEKETALNEIYISSEGDERKKLKNAIAGIVTEQEKVRQSIKENLDSQTLVEVQRKTIEQENINNEKKANLELMTARKTQADLLKDENEKKARLAQQNIDGELAAAENEKRLAIEESARQAENEKNAAEELARAEKEKADRLKQDLNALAQKPNAQGGGSYVDENGNLHMSTRRNDNMNIPQTVKDGIKDILKKGGNIRGEDGGNLQKQLGELAYKNALVNGASEKQAREARKNAERNTREAITSSWSNDMANDARRGVGQFSKDQQRRAEQQAKAKEDRAKSLEKSRESLKDRAERLKNGGGGNNVDGFQNQEASETTILTNIQNTLTTIKTKMDKLGLK